jgi:hypothetical protein
MYYGNHLNLIIDIVDIAIRVIDIIEEVHTISS